MTVHRLDHTGIVVEDLAAAIAFFVELGLELEGQAAVEGEWVDQLVGLDGVRADIAVVRTPDGHGRVELSTFHTPVATSAAPRAPVNTPGIPRLTFSVDAVDDVLDRLRADGAELVGEVATALRGHLPVLLRPRPRRHHHRAGRGAPLNDTPSIGITA